MSFVDKSLKTQNLKWLWRIVVADILVITIIISPNIFPLIEKEEFAGLRILLGTGIAPVLALIFTSLLTSNVKAILVFWRYKDILPGHRAFSVYASKDVRINLDTLRKKVATFPEAAREQNTLWYKLYKEVEEETAVVQAQRYYLLFRDITAFSLLSILSFTVLMYFNGLDINSACKVFLFLLGQYLVVAIAARNYGISFVTNVLAIHSL